MNSEPLEKIIQFPDYIDKRVKKIHSYLLLTASVLASLSGVALFVFLFVLDFNIYWLILSPVIFAIYQGPAVYLYWLWKKKKND